MTDKNLETTDEKIDNLKHGFAKVILSVIIAPLLVAWIAWVSSAGLEAIERIAVVEQRSEFNKEMLQQIRDDVKYLRDNFDKVGK